MEIFNRTKKIIIHFKAKSLGLVLCRSAENRWEESAGFASMMKIYKIILAFQCHASFHHQIQLGLRAWVLDQGISGDGLNVSTYSEPMAQK